MNDHRNLTKTLSALTLLVVGSTAGVAMAGTNADPSASAALETPASLTTLNDLAMDEFDQTAKANNLLAAADGHHDDSIGSHHHHAIVSATTADRQFESGRFDV
ncbi:hypothetical protein ACQR5V_11610 [Xanthomonas oryzae pv. oryzicola]|uniref:hypothetical protein n=1 Tax=Xanthomonas oryzae TaxID=347 RepID=UPI0003FEA6C7|nr:hypothetical protein [Xanthomonas oryzae]AJQ86266.1 hypothetical protein BE73_03415 [Xanthomonas oryzae pv. oryzicola]AKN92124.1 hypothetical protein ACU13_02685 [Xanthomonas oryzae pv. oryzicola]AKN95863.1 hypothetical protein ACU10_02685 [Xanthomonas oryzae pv. oryzicola]AKO05856.1 hypothetical protein ACU16_18860 [Xanthomonas oryzae pv. oryzicola]AKO07220.1 hypothetical protein ACU17_03065 [Xanthomonas oryzae pv. oryzicola]